MSRWPATKAKRVLAALLRIGWRVKRSSSSHKTLERDGFPDVDVHRTTYNYHGLRGLIP